MEHEHVWVNTEASSRCPDYHNGNEDWMLIVLVWVLLMIADVSQKPQRCTKGQFTWSGSPQHARDYFTCLAFPYMTRGLEDLWGQRRQDMRFLWGFVVGAALIKVARLSAADKCAMGLNLKLCVSGTAIHYRVGSERGELQDLNLDVALWKRRIKVVNKSALNGNADGP